MTFFFLFLDPSSHSHSQLRSQPSQPNSTLNSSTNRRRLRLNSPHSSNSSPPSNSSHALCNSQQFNSSPDLFNSQQFNSSLALFSSLPSNRFTFASQYYFDEMLYNLVSF
jgi:hypothetical protein